VSRRINPCVAAADRDPTTCKNQGDCVSSFASKGKNKN